MKNHEWMTDEELVDEVISLVYLGCDASRSPLRSEPVQRYKLELMRRLSVAKDQPRGSVDKFAPTEQAKRKGL